MDCPFQRPGIIAGSQIRVVFAGPSPAESAIESVRAGTLRRRCSDFRSPVLENRGPVESQGRVRICLTISKEPAARPAPEQNVCPHRRFRRLRL